MAELRIRFRMNLESGEREIIVELEKDAELMRHEHERKHREVVERLLGEGIIGQDEVDQVRVERVAPELAERDRSDASEPRGEQASEGA